MTGALLKIDAKLDDHQIKAALERLVHVGANMKLVFQDIAEYLIPEIRQRFDDKVDPSGKPWEPLTAATIKRKGHALILQDRGYLKHLLIPDATNDHLIIGSNRVYAAIHQFGGEIDIAARSQQVYFKRSKDGSVGNRFTSKRKSDFAQWASMAAYKITIPSRRFLGLSVADRTEILRIIGAHADRALSGVTGALGR